MLCCVMYGVGGTCCVMRCYVPCRRYMLCYVLCVIPSVVRKPLFYSCVFIEKKLVFIIFFF